LIEYFIKHDVKSEKKISFDLNLTSLFAITIKFDQPIGKNCCYDL